MTRKKLILCALALTIVVVPGFVYVCCVLWPSSHMKSARSDVPRPAVIAHRGASYLAPEETEPAYLLARDLGADYLEMDVQRTKDHVLIALHDDTLERMTNVARVFPGREKNGVEDFTLSELKQLDAGSWFNALHPDLARKKYADAKILTIEEVLKIAEQGENKPSLYMETKSPERHPGYEKELVDLLGTKGWLGKFDNGISKVVFQSFDAPSLQRLKDLAPDVPRVYLLNKDMVKRSGWNKLIADAAALGDGIGPAGDVCWPWNLGKAHQAGLLVHVYTINVNWQFRLFSFCGADGFFTDRCDALMRYYGKRNLPNPDDILARWGY